MNDIQYDHPSESCGVIGIYAVDEDAARMAFYGLFALQHRGQEAAGIAVADGSNISLYKNVGLVSQVFRQSDLDDLEGHLAIGHTRYSTTGSSCVRNAQPFFLDTINGQLALAHNGNLVNSSSLRKELLLQGIGMSTSSDSEVMAMMLARNGGATWVERIRDAMCLWKGAYSLMILTQDGLYAVRDPWGLRPLSVGLLSEGGAVAASETGALRTLGCRAIREVKPGEIVTLSDKALRVTQAIAPASPLARCIFELIYFSRPDSIWDDKCIHQIRQNLGCMLAEESPVEADVVIPVPDSSIPAAIGYAAKTGIRYNDGFIKNRYVGRTFIEPTDSLRKRGVALKFNVIIGNVLNKRVVMIDDSIVRGNTTGPLVRLLKEAGAESVHVRITCPPIKYPCFMGVDMGARRGLIAAHRTVGDIRRAINADSLSYLSLEGMMNAVGASGGYCQACFTGKYPFEVDHSSLKTRFEKGNKK